jgi:putative ABC transport system substrate-binding protein
MRRRLFLAGFSSAALSPLTTQGQQDERMRRIAALFPRPVDDVEAKARLEVFQQSLMQLGWSEGRNVKIDVRWSGANIGDVRKDIADLVNVAPDVILATGSPTLGPLLQATRTVPIVFASVADPVGSGFVESLARPGGNATGFSLFDYSLAAKWPELLKQIAPSVTRAAVIRDAATPPGIGAFAVIQYVAPSVGIELTPVDARDASEVERAVTAFSREPNGGLIVTASAVTATHRDLIIRLAARHKLPSVYWQRVYAASGGLVSYGPDLLEQYRRAAGYVDRILRGENPASLPVQAPTKYELVINLQTAKAEAITIHPSLLARADEVIE